MALIISTDIKPVKVQAFGNWFEFKPGQIKNMQQNLADFLTREKRSYGFVAISENFEDPAYKDTVEGKAEIDSANEIGRKNVVAELMYRKRNLEVSLQKDLDVKGLKVSALTHATAADKEVYERLAEFKNLKQDQEAQELENLIKLKEQIDGSPNRANS